MKNLDLGFKNLSFQNLVINGAFDYWQRGTSIASISTGQYTTDRFRIDTSGSQVITVERDTDVPTEAVTNYSAKISVTTANASPGATDLCIFRHYVEGYNFRPYKGKTLSLSFWIKSPKTGQHMVTFGNAGASPCYMGTYTVSAINTWQKIQVTLTHDPSGSWDYTTGIGLQLNFTFVAGTDYQSATVNQWKSGFSVATSSTANLLDSTSNVIKFAEIMLNEGTDAAPFVRAGINVAEELRLCQRYYQLASQWWVNYNGNSDFVGKFTTEMRTAPSAEGSGAITYNILGIGSGSCTVSNIVGTSTTGAIIRCVSFSGAVTGNLLAITSNGVAWSAEL